MQLNIRAHEGGIIRLESVGEIRLGDDMRTPSSLDSLLGPDCYSKTILLDLGKSPYIDSSGVSWLVKSHKLCKNAGGALIIHSIPHSVMSILKLLRMEQVLLIADDEQAARTLATGGIK